MAAPAPDPVHPSRASSPAVPARPDASWEAAAGHGSERPADPVDRRRRRGVARPGMAMLLVLALASGLAAGCTPVARRDAGTERMPAAADRASSSPGVSRLGAAESDATTGEGLSVVPAAYQRPGPDRRQRDDRDSISSAAAAPAAPFVAAGPASLTVPVLTYHQVNPWLTGDEYVIPPSLFEAQLQALVSRGWRTITAHDLGLLLATRGAAPDRTFVVTIDDGWQDGLDHALPILRHLGLVATYYVVPSLVGTHRYLTWDGVRALRDAGMEIGNHTLHHARLTQLTAAEARREVREAEQVLTRELGEEPDTFAYPFGAFNATAVAAVRDSAMLLAFTSQTGTVSTWEGRLTLPRIHVGPATTVDGLLRAMGALAAR